MCQIYTPLFDKDYKVKIGEGKQVGTIYYFTTARNFIKIIQSNFILKSRVDDVSFTRNFKLVNLSKPGYFALYKIRINIDGNKLSNKYKIVPYLDLENKIARVTDEENEEHILEEKVDIKNNIKSITILDNEYEYEDDIIQALEKHNIPFEIVTKWRPVR